MDLEARLQAEAEAEGAVGEGGDVAAAAAAGAAAYDATAGSALKRVGMLTQQRLTATARYVLGCCGLIGGEGAGRGRRRRVKVTLPPNMYATGLLDNLHHIAFPYWHLSRAAERIAGQTLSAEGSGSGQDGVSSTPAGSSEHAATTIRQRNQKRERR